MRIIHLSFLFILNSLSILCSAQDFEGEIEVTFSSGNIQTLFDLIKFNVREDFD